ncbi:MAG: DUF1573 domain-containing protein [Anaerolineales bacterium]
MATKAETRRERLAKRRRDSQAKRYLSIVALLGGAGLIVAAVISLRSGDSAEPTSFNYGPEDISYDKPIQAVHEMEAGPPILFLPKDGAHPEIQLNEVFYNFGSLGPAEVVTRDFAIANMGEAPLTISRAYTTCGCTTADFTSAVIPPGGVSVVTVRFDAGFHDARGQTVRRGIIIENNDPDRPQTEYWVEASVRSTG